MLFQIWSLFVATCCFAEINAQQRCPEGGSSVTLFDRFQFGLQCRNPLPQPGTGPRPILPPTTPPPVESFFVPLEPDPPAPCPPKPNCPKTIERFYRPDGSCNNLLDGRKGKAGQPHKRLLPADYSDGKALPRRGQGNRDLPSARIISTTMKEVVRRESPDKTNFGVIWGQFITHDITDTPVIDREGRGIDCRCGTRDPGCHNVDVPFNDRFFVEEGRTCLPLVRSQPVPDIECNTDVRQTKNDITPYLDAGTVYGHSQFQLDELLDKTSPIGELKTGQLHPHGFSPPHAPSLPLVTQVHSSLRDVACPFGVHKPQNVPCFVGGDVRANENPALASMHTLLVRLHNKLVKDLSNLNRNWDKTRLINTARLIVSAVVQRVTYKQFLPELLGPTYMKRFDLELNEEGYWYGYDSSYDATTSNAFITAVLRVGHTLVNPELSRSSPNFGTQGTTLNLKTSFFDSNPLLTTDQGGANSILRGLTKDAAEIMDSTIADDLQNFLFAPQDFLGSDLLSLNLQRGREHGVPSYNAFRVFCGLKRARRFSDFTEIPRNRQRKLEGLYRNVDDVDLYIAGISETSVPGGLLGPTFACLAGYQFRDLKKGDRLWHENGGAFTVFTPAQLEAIRQYTLSKVLCDNLNDMRSVQPNPFLQTTVRGNSRVPCYQIPQLNLEAWRSGESEPPFPESVKHEFTSWFPATHDDKTLTCTQVHNELLANRPDDVCSQVLGFEERTVNGKKQVRFSCAAGSIRATDYPNVDASKGVWGDWEDISTPSGRKQDDDESLDSQTSTCEGPIAIQVHTLGGTPARETGEVFRKFSVTAGFLCMGNDQRNGRCQDYQVRYFCKKIGRSTRNPPPNTPAPSSAFVWTNWLSVDRPSGDGDQEYLFNVVSRNGFCRHPVQIEARTVRSHIPASFTGDIFTAFSHTIGLECRNIIQPSRRCNDYEVRYRCRSTDINGLVPLRDFPSFLPPDVQRRKQELCSGFGVCCA
ncbi:unnamed protein product [Clavelina lepadiformis]|uniref:WxxW domain-containing protein n=1 Tax=Clavelina lepadiformis TaxID=159417 RepID=A0ABP0G0J8_CLALP